MQSPIPNPQSPLRSRNGPFFHFLLNQPSALDKTYTNRFAIPKSGPNMPFVSPPIRPLINYLKKNGGTIFAIFFRKKLKTSFLEKMGIGDWANNRGQSPLLNAQSPAILGRIFFFFYNKKNN